LFSLPEEKGYSLSDSKSLHPFFYPHLRLDILGICETTPQLSIKIQINCLTVNEIDEL